jgi:hypothetical protein
MTQVPNSSEPEIIVIEYSVLPLLVFNCGGLQGREDDVEDLVDDDARSIEKARHFGANKDFDPTLLPHDLGDQARENSSIQEVEGGIKWIGPRIDPGTRLGYVEGELGEEGIFLPFFNTQIAKQGWYWMCAQGDNNITVNQKGAIVSVKEILPGQFLIRK